MKVILIDDEPNAITTLQNYIYNYTTGITIVGKGSSKKDAIELIKNNTFDVLFLDINLGDGTGFEVLDSISEKNFKIVFTTAYDEHAIKAFKYSAIDYLLKPLNPDEFMEAVQRLKEDDDIKTLDQLELVRSSLKEKQSNKIAITTVDEIHFINITDIIRLESFRNYTDIFTKYKKITASKTLKYFEQLLPETQFFRTHQCHITNLNFVEKFVKKQGGYLELHTGEMIPVSRRKKG